MNFENIIDLCNNTIFCPDEDCQSSHQRKYVGLCLEYLKKDLEDEESCQANKKCSDDQCTLYHFNLEKVHLLLQISPINGVWGFNLCPHNICQQGLCKFIHRKWAQGICLSNLIKICKNKNCENRHVQWDKLRREVYTQYNVAQINPENICENEQCNCPYHLEGFQNLCLKYLQGNCPNKICLKQHCDWEHINQISCQKQQLLPCTSKIQGNSFIDFLENAKRFEIQQVCEKEKLINFQREIHQSNIIDVIFILDLTKSMNRWLEAIKKQIAKLIYQFKEKINGYGVRIGFVGYRDTCDEEEQLVYRCLTENFEEIIKVISKQVAQGGGDQAEDIVTALEQGLNLNISRHPDSILCTFLITDAPCHGNQYHSDEISDDQSDAVEQGHLENIILKYKEAKNLSFFTCFKIRNSTDIMFNKMQDVFPDIMITRKSQPDDFPTLVKFAIESSITKSINRSMFPKTTQKFYSGAKFIKPKIINYQFSEAQIKKSLFWTQFIDIVDQFQRQGVTALEINQEPEITKINVQNYSNYNKNYLDHTNTCVFKIFDALNNRFMAVKLSKEHVKKYLDNQLTEEDIKIAEELAKSRYYVAAHASQLAFLFRELTKGFDEIPPIFYVSPILYTLDIPFYGLNLLYAETFIDSAKFQWKKYSTNGAFTSPQFYFYSAFSHFTYTETEGTLVVLDLQGSNNILTDASIQSADGMIPLLEKDPTNQKQIGIMTFLQKQHEKCSIVCQKLNLSRKNFSIANPQIDHLFWNIQDHQMISILCETCSQQRLYSLDQYKQMKEIKCDICRDLEKQPIDAICRCCSQMYHHDPNEDLLSLTVYGYCKFCKINCCLRQNRCLYCLSHCWLNLKQIGEFSQYVCKSGYQYLQVLHCQVCKSQYQFKQILSEQEYKEGIFICCNNQ
ncbi:unnamed protein product (macronuclear) [Paramecium tetraurelia]|uniref:Alpha-type protein kinase domain-containing protein n=1 Tax=Paramecium tetraurelia TaxID=5888 RepID=A0C4L0_PARTE|nr:uncharacterized protein GSPATT00006226001 [Paramecium tetraurelia]CAK65727.1 unnamed protein product [Paramecium tetraurelia]|eukprot:XP_001433124.1 hypothetical protein (macronuclear) [Paramecium tetraurelia strain d4-2]